MSDPFIYLASQSPRRRELLHQIGVAHRVVSVDVAETPAPHESALVYVQRLAREKSAAGWAAVAAAGLPAAPVLGADTLGVLDGVILEKPRDRTHALAMLRQLSGRTHQVITAVALRNRERVLERLSITEVRFRALSDAEIAAYWETGEPRDKAGSYAIQGLGAVFVESIQGSYSSVVGLPIEATVALLRELGVPWWQAPMQESPV
ncbi:Maf family protein [Cellvibrio japonicus]|uniref:Maf family protein n=1 Tax=Cellvibrio japonicus TaxID=155077 RepID=UPI0002E5BBAE|nr:Maf family protein [Cellvibrio japonicus]QEI13158.1 septum formation inhibitor Maf [Cellvibrio japonicus]QEI16732.1 septum formation inhibitor Maf [Cellvibrio japonicus]QEI20310.1 septum formation inhibitor Maf [Cellvibrio japonicus]